MPRPPRFNTAAVEELYRQLRFASRAARRREMDAAETLVGELDPTRNYPADFIVYRVTGYRSDAPSEPVMLVGAAVVPDLVTLVQRLSEEVDLPPDYRGRIALDLEQVRARLSVSPRTLQRYRRQGLVCHYVTGEDGILRLACFSDALERFVDGRRDALASAAAFERLADAQVDQIVAEATRMHADERVSLNEAARRLAERHGRAHETVRGILRRHDRQATRPVFVEPGPLSSRDIRFLDRALRFGVPARRLRSRFGKSAAALHHAMARLDRRRLAELELAWVDLPTFALPDADDVILSPPAVCTRLEDPIGADVLDLIARAHRGPAPAEADIIALVAAYNLLKRRVAGAIATLPAVPRRGLLDPIETDLRWAAMVKRKLAGMAVAPAIGAIEQYLGRGLADAPGETVLGLVRRGLAVISVTLETVDPGRDQPFDRRIAFAIDRVLAAEGVPSSSRAAARHQPGSLRLTERERRLCPWQAWTDPRPDLFIHAGDLAPADRALVAARYGRDGGPPQSLSALADRFQSTPAGVARKLGRIERELRTALRE